MPYETNSDLPEQTRHLSEHEKTIFRKAFNSAKKQYGDDETAFRVAWSAVRKAGYKPMDKNARNIYLLTKVANYMVNPCADPRVKVAAVKMIKRAFDFGQIGNSVGGFINTIGSGISDIGSSLGSTITSSVSSLLSVDPNQIISKLNALSPEISGLISELQMQGWSAADIVKELPQDIISAL